MPGLNDPYAAFYSGGMLAPDRVGNTLVPAQIYSQPTSVSDMYKGIYADVPATPSSVYDVGYDPNYPVSGGFLPNTWATGGAAPQTRVAASGSTSVPHANGTVAFDKGQDQLPAGNLLAFGMPAGPKMNAGAAAIEKAAPRNVADMYGSAFTGGWGSNGFLSFEPAQVGAGAPTGWTEWERGGTGRTPARPGMVTGPRPASVPPPPPQPGVADMFHAVTSNDPLQIAVRAAQAEGQTYDRSRDPSFNPNGGAHGGSLAGF